VKSERAPADPLDAVKDRDRYSDNPEEDNFRADWAATFYGSLQALRQPVQDEMRARRA
jgi:hypothetical protein